MSIFKYNAFLSFSTNPDYRLSQKVESFLETFHRLRTPTEIQLEKLEICRDGSDFQMHGTSNRTNNEDNIYLMLEDYLKLSEFLIVLCSSKTPYSAYVKYEIEWFIRHKGQENILLAVTEGRNPSLRPELIFPDVIIQHQLHKKPFYDLRGFKKKEVKK